MFTTFALSKKSVAAAPSSIVKTVIVWFSRSRRFPRHSAVLLLARERKVLAD